MPMASYVVLILSLIVVTFLLCSHLSDAADRALLDKICRQTRQYNSCMSTFIEDARTPTADINGLCAISVANGQGQAQATLEKIKNTEKSITDPVDRRRIQTCEADYGDAVALLTAAFNSASNRRDYTDVINKVRDGGNKAIDCEDNYRRDPIRPSPVSGDNNRMVDLVEITFIIVQMIQTGQK